MRLSRSRGFTLIEIMIVVGIVGMLAAIAISRYQQYILHSKRGESYMTIGGIIAAQTAFLATYDDYANIVAPNPGMVPDHTKHGWVTIPCGACSRVNTAACTSFQCIGYASSGDVYFNYNSPEFRPAPNLSAETDVGACSDLDVDGLQSCLQYPTGNGGGAVGIVPNPMTNAAGCPMNTPVYDLITCTPVLF